MWTLLFALQAAAAPTAIDAERMFAAAAKQQGQWTAFRRFADPHAVMFVPQPVEAQAFLKEKADPPTALDWWPTASFVACDGLSAVNTGGWRQPDGQVGYFSTVWRAGTPEGWHWTVDGGDALATPRPRPAVVAVRRAACAGTPPPAPDAREVEGQTGKGASADGSLAWRWHVSATGARTFRAYLWDGASWATVIDDRIAAPSPTTP